MANITCKMCGGDIVLSKDMTYGTCQYCGSTITLPKIDDEQRASAFNRGNYFRRIGEFDKAVSVYERIINENNADSEAHWCLALSRFGIEYVKDTVSGEYVPTCHRASFDSFLEDVDYQAALEYSDGVTKKQYEKDAERIMMVQKGLLAISQREEKFDIFICYKESDDDGNRTKDSVLAQDIYYSLTEQGYRVFFSRITLEDKAGMEYEPYIFAALHSAKVMIVVGTKPEYLNAVWVKNEWSRYLAIVKNDNSKVILPCYRDMEPYDMPEKLSILQAYDMGKIGFVQDLLRGIKKVIQKDEPNNKNEKSDVIQSVNTGNWNVLVKRGNMALEDGEFDKADEFFEQALNQNAECGEAYLGKKLAKERCSSIDDYIKKCTTFPQKKLIQIETEVDAKWKKYIGDCISGLQNGSDISSRGIEEIIYSIYDKNTWMLIVLLEKQYKKVKYDMETDKLIKRALQYGDSRLQLSVKQCFEKELSYLDKKLLQEKDKEKEYLNQINNKLQTQKKEFEEKYQLACRYFDNKEYNSGIKIFEEIIYYKDSKRKIEQIKEIEQKQQLYQDACDCINDGKLIFAIEFFKMAGDYKDSKQQIEQIEHLIKKQGRISLIRGLIFGLAPILVLGILYWFLINNYS